VRVLLDIIAGRTDVPERVLLPVHLVRRVSCGARDEDRVNLSTKE
jgi:DNA-binding LacI/PurR family transcriptional regulator